MKYNQLTPATRFPTNENILATDTASLNTDLYNEFVAYLGKTPKTIETYTRALKQFRKWTQANQITNPTRANLMQYRSYLFARNEAGEIKPATIQNYMIAVKQFFNWLHIEKQYPNITEKVEGAKIDREHKKDPLTKNQVKEILNAIDRSSLHGKRDYAVLALMITGGLRTIEVSRANVEDLRTLGDHTVMYIQGKGRAEKATYIKVPPQVEKAIRSYLQARKKAEPSDPLFTSISNNSAGHRLTTRSISGTVKQRMIQAGYDSDRLTAHSLRHTAGTLNLLNGATLEETQQLLRHVDINTTLIYAHHLERINNKSEERIASLIL